MNDEMMDAVSELGQVLSDDVANGVYRKNPYRLAKRMLRRQGRNDGQISPIFLVVVGTSRYCYSRAEGGCWADWDTILEVRKVWGVANGVRALHELKQDYPQPRFNRYSCANRGEEDYRIVVCASEDEFPQETTEPATYE